MLLEIDNLSVEVSNKKILDKVSLKVGDGEFTVLMGPNGSGKTTLAYSIMGREGYNVIEGDIKFRGSSILGLSTYERSRLGIFLVMQNPPTIPGVNIRSFLKYSYRGLKPDTKEPANLMEYAKELLTKVGLPSEYIEREVNKGFSGGEKKRFEIFQAILFRPRLLIMDEPDSGLDVDGVKMIADTLSQMKGEGKGILLITHNPRLLNYITPDRVYVMINGSTVYEGDYSIVHKIDMYGYDYLKGDLNE